MNFQSLKKDTLSETVQPAGSRRRELFKYGRVAAIVVLVLGVGIWAADWVRSTLIYVHETDARIHSDVISVSSRVAGWVVKMPATSGLKVAKSDLLATIDGRDSQLRHTALIAERNGLIAERERLQAEIAMVDERTRSRQTSEQAKLAAAKELLAAMRADFEFAKVEFSRAETLARRGVIAVKELDRNRAAFLRRQQEMLRAQTQVATAEALVADAASERQQLHVLRSGLAKLDHRQAEIEARTSRQELDLRDRAVVSPVGGIVSQTFVTVGEYVIPGQRIAMVHDPNDIWIEANIRETEVRHLAVGQHVNVVVDAYPDQAFHGRIERIGHATTSQFSLLPSSNPSGNFTKVTQRLPVRIAIEQQQGLLRPGMMVEVYIDVDGD